MSRTANILWGLSVLLGVGGASCVPTPAGVDQPLPREVARIETGESIPGMLAADLDGDGLDELVLSDISAGEYPRTEAGEVRVLERPVASGSWTELPSRLVLRGDAPFRHLGSGVMAADLDGDGTKDLVLRTDSTPEGQGKVYVVSGNLRGEHGVESAAFLEITGPATLGQAISSLDYDGDGSQDLVVSCPVRSQVYVIRGPRTGQITLPEEADAVLSTETGSLGWTVGTGDFDGDGGADLAISEPVSDRIFLAHAGALGAHAVEDVAWSVIRSSQAADDLIGADVLERTGASAAGLMIRSRRTDIEQQGTAFILNGPIRGDVDLRSDSYMTLNYTASVLSVCVNWVPWGDGDSWMLAVGTAGKSQIPDSNLKGGLWLLDPELQGEIRLDASLAGRHLRPQDVGLDWWGRDVMTARLADPGQRQLLVSAQGTVIVFDQP